MKLTQAMQKSIGGLPFGLPVAFLRFLMHTNFIVHPNRQMPTPTTTASAPHLRNVAGRTI
jgi:hypothetical protein